MVSYQVTFPAARSGDVVTCDTDVFLAADETRNATRELYLNEGLSASFYTTATPVRVTCRRTSETLTVTSGAPTATGAPAASAGSSALANADIFSIHQSPVATITAAFPTPFPSWELTGGRGTSMSIDDVDPTLMHLAAGLYLCAVTIQGQALGAPAAVQVSYFAPNSVTAPPLPRATGDPWLPFIAKSATEVELAGSQAFFVYGDDAAAGPPVVIMAAAGSADWTPDYVGMDWIKLA